MLKFLFEASELREQSMTSHLDQVLGKIRESEKLYTEQTQNIERMMRESVERKIASFSEKLLEKVMIELSMCQVESSEKRLERMEEDIKKLQEAWHEDLMWRERTFEEEHKMDQDVNEERNLSEESSGDELRNMQKHKHEEHKKRQGAIYDAMARNDAAVERERGRHQDKMRETKLCEEPSRSIFSPKFFTCVIDFIER